jgi:hypothetical protein
VPPPPCCVFVPSGVFHTRDSLIPSSRVRPFSLPPPPPLSLSPPSGVFRAQLYLVPFLELGLLPCSLLPLFPFFFLQESFALNSLSFPLLELGLLPRCRRLLLFLFLLEVGTGKKIPPGRVFGNDTVWAVRFGYCRDGYNLVCTDSHICRRDFCRSVCKLLRGLGRGVARGIVVGGYLVPTYVFYLRRYLFPNRLRMIAGTDPGTSTPPELPGSVPDFFAGSNL